MKSKVVIVKCESYEGAELKAAVRKGLKVLGGVQAFAKDGEKILFKPNLLIGDKPEKCSTTHPELLKAVLSVFKEDSNAELSFGDSPGFGSPKGEAKKAGMLDAAAEVGVELADFKNGKEVSYEAGVQNKKFTIANGVLESDGIISLPKMKTHGLEKFTGAVKNQFGVVPGLLKGEFHVRLPDAVDFASMLVDLNMFVNPRLYIMDGVYAMEGVGPRSGSPKKMDMLVFSSDPIAMDATVCRIIGMTPEYVPTITLGEERGHGTSKEEEIEIVCDDEELLSSRGFVLDNSTVKRYDPTKRGLVGFIANMAVSKPVIKDAKCVRCAVCINVCPADPKALEFPKGDKTKAPVYDYSKCIRCYCCQEMCPEGAVELRKPLLRRLLPF